MANISDVILIVAIILGGIYFIKELLERVLVGRAIRFESDAISAISLSYEIFEILENRGLDSKGETVYKEGIKNDFISDAEILELRYGKYKICIYNSKTPKQILQELEEVLNDALKGEEEIERMIIMDTRLRNCKKVLINLCYKVRMMKWEM